MVCDDPAIPGVADRLERWLALDGERTLGGLVSVFEEKSFAVIFVLLLGVSALPLPTGGATHLFEVVAVLLALELVAGRQEIWLPARWQALDIGTVRRRRSLARLLRMIRRLERMSRPRLRFLFGHRVSNLVFGLLVIGGSVAAFVAPPFTGLDTLPSLGVVLLSLGVLLEDFVVVVAGLVAGVVGVVLEILLGRAVLHELVQLI